MNNSQINLDNILEQAPKWTFAGDFTLLQWMQQISQDLETRATKTSDDLTKLNNNIKSTNIALDNVANSLTTLQFGNQFVESRVQDDDETLVNINEQSGDKENQPEKTATSKELLNTFLENNLKVLRNCHERYSIDLEDSDDEELSKEKTCIYQPINPYNEKPLPYIFGSKDWHAKWHVGLYENQQDNSYSGDEISEAFSETSSTSHVDDNESFESNTEWASNNSIDNDNFNSNFTIKNASSLRGSQPLYPGTPTPYNAGKSKQVTISESSSVSTTPSSMAKNSVQTQKQIEILTESMSSINPETPSKPATKLAADKNESTSQYKSLKPNVIDLFAEPIEDKESETSSSVSVAPNVKRVANDNQSIRKETAAAIRSQPRQFVDLFADPPEDFSSSTTSSLSSSSHNVKRKIVNLFDDDDDDRNMTLTKEDELKKPQNKENTFLTSKATASTKNFSSLTRNSKANFDEKEEQLEESANEENTFLHPITSPATGKSSTVTKTSKSLFDDSDDDDDFLKAFVKKSLPKDATKTSLSKTLPFDNEVKHSAINSSLQSSDEAQNLFDKMETKDDLLSNKFLNIKSQISTHKTEQDAEVKSRNISIQNNEFLDEPTVEKNVQKSSVNVFNDLVGETKTNKKINLFDDLDDGEDLFSTKPKNIKEIPQKTDSTEREESEEKPKENIFKFVDDKTVIQDTKYTEKVIENIFSESDSVQDVNSIKYQVESIGNDKITSKHFASAIVENTSGNKMPKVPIEDDDEEKVYDPSKQELNSISTFPQSTENKVLSSIPEDNNQQQNSSNKYEFNSILFSDEPPEDDDEFFDTLAKTPSTLNSNFNTIDLENDIFEAELPKIPASNASSNQNDSTDNFYTGLQLFSDIPPDDDAMGTSTSNLPPHINQTKRLHSVFYDDFDETLMALNQKHIEKEIPKHSIFNQEPPAINDHLSISGKDLTDHKVPENNSKLEETTQQADANSFEFSNNRPVSKLQMPHININVQALLPGTSNSLRKPKEDHKTSIVIPSLGDDSNQAVYLSGSSSSDSQLNVLKSNFKKTLRTAETEHILPNLTKNRVKAPASRRPSSRRARQENYHKSLIDQHNTLLSDEENTEINTAIQTDIKNSISQILLPKHNTKDAGDIVPEKKHSPITKTASTSIPSENQNVSKVVKVTKDNSLHDTKSGQRDEPKSSIPVHNIEKPTSSVMVSCKNTESSSIDVNEIKSRNETPKTAKSTLKSKPLNTSLFFDDEEDDTDFFKHIKTVNILENQKPKENENKKSSISETNTNVAIMQENQQSQTLNKEFPIDNFTTTKKQQNPQTSDIKISKQLSTDHLKSFLDDKDDDEDLFNTAITTPRRSLSYKERNKKAKSEFKSFLDSETDEEPNVAGLQEKIPTAAPANLKNNNTITRLKLKDDKPKLFSDSETDSDSDLFGKLAHKKVSNNKKALTETKTTKPRIKPEPKSSLFEDESDSDNFLSSVRSSNENADSKSSLNKSVPKHVTQTNKSLFSDLDSDEDDLFGGGGAKVTSSSVTHSKATSTSQTPASAAESSKSKIVHDNPLADLL